ncbi:hypothetical protein QTP88_019833 [Uroleucon formosanum]
MQGIPGYKDVVIGGDMKGHVDNENLDRKREDRAEYKSVCKIAKSAVITAKLKRYDELYERLETLEGEKEIYRLAKVRDKRPLTSKISGVSKEEESLESISWNEGLIGLVVAEEVKIAAKAMKKKKAVGPDGMPVEVWKILGNVSIRWLKDLFNKMLIEGKMPEVWRKDMYDSSSTSVKSMCVVTEDFKVRVGVHQESALSPYLFSVVMGEITKEIQEVPSCMMFADDIVLIGENMKDVNNRLNEWSCKSTSTHLKLQPNTPENYSKIIHFLNENEAQFHTYQLQSDKASTVVIRNLHSSTLVSEISSALEEIGHSVRKVTNILHYQTKNPLPLFFVDLKPDEHNNDVFDITSILHTKIKIEEPHIQRHIPQCIKCLSYGHTKSYCSHLPRCVKCGGDHFTASCTKSRESPAICALCNGNHPANYKGCIIYKETSTTDILPIQNKPLNNSSTNTSTLSPATNQQIHHLRTHATDLMQM